MDKYVLVAQKFHVHLLRRVALGDGGHATMLRLNGSSWLLRPVVYVQNQVRLPCDIYEQLSSAVWVQGRAVPNMKKNGKVKGQGHAILGGL